MAIPTIYRRVNPQWLADFRLAHNNPPVGYFNANYVAPNPYLDS